MNTINIELVQSTVAICLALVLCYVAIALIQKILKQASIIHDNRSWKKMNRDAWDYECERVARLNRWLETHDSHEALMWTKVARLLDQHLDQMSYHFRNL